MTSSRPCCLSPPTIMVLCGSGGMWSSSTPWHGGKSSLRSLARVMSKNLWGGFGHHPSYPRWAVAPERWPMTIQHCWPHTPWNRTDFSPLLMWGLGDRTTTWNSPKRPWLTPRISRYWDGEIPAADARWVLPTGRACWSSDEPWNLWPHSQI